MPTLTRDDLIALRAEINNALRPLMAAHKLSKLELAKCTFDASGNFTFQLQGVVAGGLSREAALYEDLRRSDPTLPPIGATFMSQRKEFKVTGCNSTGSKIFADHILSGTTYQFPVMSIRTLCHAGRTTAADA